MRLRGKKKLQKKSEKRGKVWEKRGSMIIRQEEEEGIKERKRKEKRERKREWKQD